MHTVDSERIPGQPRGVAFVVIISLITFSIYTIYWIFKTHDEMRRWAGEGLGGVLGLVVWLLIMPVSAFVIPSEAGKLYTRAGAAPPVTGWTGLWLFPFGIFLIPAIVWLVKVQGALNRFWEEQATAGA